MQKVCGRFVGWIVASVIFVLGMMSPAESSAQQALSYRMRATFAGYNKDVALTNFPVLIALNEDITDFRYSQFASPNGYDLRVYDASFTNALAYEIESWKTNGTSSVWVRVPCLSSSDDHVWICWGDATQTNRPAYTTNGVAWSADYRLVVHMGDGNDSSANQAGGTSSNVVYDVDGIGHSGLFNGTNSMLTFDPRAVLKPASQITISAWVKPSDLAAARYRNIYRKDDSGYRHLLAFQEYGTVLSFGLNVDGVYSELDVPINAADYEDTWHLVTAVYDGGKKRVFRDGIEIANTNLTGVVGTSNTMCATVGYTQSTNVPPREFFLGRIDEVRVSGSGRPADWVWACYKNQRADSDFVFFGPVIESLFVRNLNDSGSDSLRDCLEQAESGNVIRFAEGVTGTLTLTNGALALPDGVSIEGPGPELLTVDGNGAGRIFVAETVSSGISGLTISNGLASGVNGGALYQVGGDLTVANCQFRGNRSVGASGGSGGYGGAVYTTNGVFTAEACVFENNVAVGPNGLPEAGTSRSGGGGGGAGLGGAVCVFGGTGHFSNSLFATNRANGGKGGTARYDVTTTNGGHGGGPAGGAGGTGTSAAGQKGGMFSGGGGGFYYDYSSGVSGGAGGFGGGGGGGGGASSGTGGSGGAGGQYGGNGGLARYSGGGGGGGGAGLGGAIFADNSQIICSSVTMTGNSAVKGQGGEADQGDGAGGVGAGGGIFCEGGSGTLELTTFTGNVADVYIDQNIVIKSNQTISFPAIPDQLATNQYALSATASSGLVVAFAVASGPAVITGGTSLSFTGAGTVTIAATQAGDDNWNAAPDMTRTFIVTRTMQAVLYFAPNSPQAYGTTNALYATGGSGTGPISYAVQSGPGQIVTSIGLNMVAITGAGTVKVVATKAADARYAAISSTGTVTAVKAGQTITFPAIGNQWVTNKVGLKATAASGLSVSFSVAQGPASITGGTNLSFTGAGRVQVVGSQAGNANWNAAPNVTNTFNSLTIAVSGLAASQLSDGSGQVKIDYSLIIYPASQMAAVSMGFSTNAGVSWTAMTAGDVTGDTGAAVPTGSRTAVWSAAQKLSANTFNNNHRVRLIATANGQTCTNVSGLFLVDLKSLNGGLKVRGRICSATTRNPLLSADIGLAGTNFTATLSNGWFTLQNVAIIKGNTLTVGNASYAGYSEQITVPAGSREVTVSPVFLQPRQPGQPVITKIKPDLQGYFIDGARMDNDFSASVNWNGLVPDRVEFFANDTLVGETTQPDDDDEYTCTIDMGSAFRASLNPRDNWVTAVAFGHDGVTLESASNTSTVYTCVMPAIDFLTNPAIIGASGEYSLALDIPPEPINVRNTLPVIGTFGFKLGIPVSFSYSIPKGGEWSLLVGGKLGKENDSLKKSGLILGKQEVEFILQGALNGVLNMEDGFRFETFGVHAECNVKFIIGYVGILDVVPAAGQVASRIPGSGEILKNFSLGIYAIPGVSGDVLWNCEWPPTFESGEITGKIGVEAAYEPKWGPLEIRIYVGGEPSVTVGFPGDFWKNVRFRAYAGASFKAWIFSASYENVFVDVKYPSAASMNFAMESGSPQFTILQGAQNNVLKPVSRDYLKAGGALFVADAKLQLKSVAGLTLLDAFRAMGQPPDKKLALASVSGTSVPITQSQASLPIIANTYPDSAPALAGVSSDLMLLYVDDNGSPGDFPCTDIMWTRWDGWNWSTPLAIATDTRAEFNPQVRYDDNGDALAVWNRVSDPDFTDVDITAMSAQMEIVWSRWDHVTGLWSEPVALTANTWLDHMPLLAGPLANGDLLVTWIENPSNLLLGTGETGSPENDTVMCSRWGAGGHAWGQSQILVSNLVDRNSQSLAASGNLAVYAWAAGTNKEVYAKVCSNDLWSAPVRCTSNSVADSNVHVALSPAGMVHMVWQQESNLVSAADFSPAVKLVRSDATSAGFADFAMTYGPLGNMVLLWQEMTAHGSDAHYSVYDPASDTWSKDATLFQDPPLERSFAPVWDNVGNLTVAYNAVEMVKKDVTMEVEGDASITVANVPQPGAVSVAVVKRALITDVAILPGDFSISGANYMPGDAVTLSTVLRNVGDIAVTNVAVAFYLGDPLAGGTLIATETWDGWLEGAATNTVFSTLYVVPEPATNLVFYAVANPDHAFTEFTETNNVQVLSIGGTDLSVGLVSVGTEANGSMLVIAKVENLGAPTATNTTLALRRDGQSGAPLAVVDVPVLEPGMSAQVAFDLPNDTQPEGSARYRLNTDELKVVMDVETNNNVMNFSAYLWLDRDNDGLPDGWETTHGLNADDPADAAQDTDNDGMTNYAEWRAGTDPNDPYSYLSVAACGVLDSGSETATFRLNWGSAANKFYTVSRSSNLALPGGGFVPLQQHISATPPVNTYDDAVGESPTGAFFYRIDVE